MKKHKLLTQTLLLQKHKLKHKNKTHNYILINIFTIIIII